MDVEQVLARVAEDTKPSVAADDLSRQLARSACEPTGRTRLRKTSLGLGIGVVLLGLGGTAYAVDAGVIPWLDWTPDQETVRVVSLDDGSEYSCPIAIKLVPSYETSIDPGQVERDLEQAKGYFRSLDLESIRTDPADLEYERSVAESLPDTVPTPSQADIDMSAWSATVTSILNNYMNENDLQAVGIESAGIGCSVINR